MFYYKQANVFEGHVCRGSDEAFHSAYEHVWLESAALLLLALFL